MGRDKTPLLYLLFVLSLLAFSHKSFGEDDNDADKLNPNFYKLSCPNVEEMVKRVMGEVIAQNPRWAASILRLHFHDCFVQGCDASILLDNSHTILSEKRSNSNRDSARGYEIIDRIKAKIEQMCPETVSCADILTLAARDGTVLTGGPNWVVPLGRRDSITTSLWGSNNDIPAPNSTLQTLITKFKKHGLDIVDLVALSGTHTIGKSRCASFRQHIYGRSTRKPLGARLDLSYATELRAKCPLTGGDQTIFSLDLVTPTKFDNEYYKNIVSRRALLNSDEVLFSGSNETMELVMQYAESNELFFEQYAKSIVKMGSIAPLTGEEGEIRRHCRRVNR